MSSHLHCNYPFRGRVKLCCALQPGPVDQPAEKLDRWKQSIAEIAAECSNVFIKCGGYQMVNSNMRLEQRTVPIGSEELCDKVLPIYQHVIRCFTPPRCMFESNVCQIRHSMMQSVVSHDRILHCVV